MIKFYINENSTHIKVKYKLELLINKRIDQATVLEAVDQSLRYIDLLKESAEKGMSAQMSKTIYSSNNTPITLEAETTKNQSFFKRIRSI